MDKKHILVVNNERNMLRTLEFILEAANYKVTAVEGGQEALRKILVSRESNIPIDLLIMEIQLPGLTGEICESALSFGSGLYQISEAGIRFLRTKGVGRMTVVTLLLLFRLSCRAYFFFGTLIAFIRDRIGWDP